MGTKRAAVGVAVVVGLSVLCANAIADRNKKKAPTPPVNEPAPAPTPSPTEPPKPWAAGVSAENQAEALALYQEGNAEFEQQHYKKAAAKYREALTHWDHPAIHFNMAVCLINLDQPLEAYDDLELALKYGDAPLGPDLYQQGLNYRKLLVGQIGTLKVVCKEPGAEVSLDGKVLFTGPGEASQRMTPGDHQVVATKAGFLTATVPIALLPQRETVVEAKLIPLEAATKMVRRWKSWKPWGVVAGGALVAGLGVLGYLQAGNDFDSYDREYALICPSGCAPDDPMVANSGVNDVKSRAEIENVVAISLLSLGGATLAAGIVGVILNQPHAVVERNVQVTPVVGPGGTAALTLRWRF